MNSFFFEELDVKIRIQKTCPTVDLISAKFSQAQIGDEKKVKIWMAYPLACYGMCDLVKPLWLSESKLNNYINKEKKIENLVRLPFNYLELGFYYLNRTVLKEDKKDKLWFLLEELNLVRLKKINFGIQKIKENSIALKIDNISFFEAITFKKLILFIMEFSFYFKKMNFYSFR